MSESSHLRLSVALLALFLASGLVLEAALGLRLRGIGDDPIRREFLRLGHAHGGILALVNLGMAWTMARLATPERWAGKVRWAGLLGAFAVGGGFAIGGLTHGPTDPGPAVLIVPAGAMALLAALVAVAIVRNTD